MAAPVLGSLSKYNKIYSSPTERKQHDPQIRGTYIILSALIST